MADPDPPADENGMQWPTTDTPSGSAPTATDPVTGASTATSAATSSSARSAESRWATSAASGSVANGADPDITTTKNAPGSATPGEQGFGVTSTLDPDLTRRPRRKWKAVKLETITVWGVRSTDGREMVVCGHQFPSAADARELARELNALEAET